MYDLLMDKMLVDKSHQKVDMAFIFTYGMETMIFYW